MAGKHMWHSYPGDKVLATLASDRKNGLTSSSVEKLQKKYGPNELPQDSGFHIFIAAWKHIKSPLALVLIAAGVTTLLLGEYLDTIVIFVAVLITVVVGILQEGKASKVFETLAQSQEKYATAIRNGKQQVIKSRELVPGDIVLLTGGSAVPADMRLLEAANLAIDESSLTGEWVPVEKRTQSVGRALPVSEQKNMAWMGTLVAEGSGAGIVVATGSRARFGEIAESTAAAEDTFTPLQQSIQRIARFLMGVIGVALAIILVLGILRGEPFAAILLLAIAVAVAAMPEGLPAAVTVVLAIGMEAILRKGGLVKNLLAAETLGSTTVIITDKTGTLTQGKMLLQGLYTVGESADSVTAAHADSKELLRMAVLASDAFVEEDPEETGKLTVRGRPIEKAIMEAGLAAGLSQVDLFANGYERLEFVQFESSRRYAISLNDCPQKGNRLYLSGSPEHLLARSCKYFIGGRERKLDEATRKQFATTQARLSAEGMRFIAIAYMRTDGTSVPKEVLEPSKQEQFVFVGLIAFSDAVREDVPAAIKEVQGAGVHVIMATGDYPETARAIAREVGIDTRPDAPVLTGGMIAEMKDAELSDVLTKYNIIARVLPEQKLRVVRSLRNRDEIVAMTGDGVNDAPALASADIGIAVGSGTDVAKAAADIVLLQNSFSVITTAIGEGRRVIRNLQKIVAYLLSTSFSEIVIIAGALAFAAPLPLLPTQILWANIVGEGFMSFPFAFEPKGDNLMKQKPQRRGVKSILSNQVQQFIFIVSAITGLLLLGLFFLLLWGGVPIEKIRTVIFVGLSIGSIFFAFSFKNLSQPIWRISFFSNRYLIGALGISIALLIGALTLPPLQKLLSLTPLSIAEVGILFVVGLLNLITVEVAKVILNKVSARKQ